jgi:hypothetical protein
VVLADLCGHVPQRLEQFGERRILGVKALRRSRQADGRQAGADRQLTCDEGGTPCGATGLGVGVSQAGTLAGNPIEIGRLVVPMIPWWYAPTSNQPTSSPMIITMLGRLAAIHVTPLTSG